MREGTLKLALREIDVHEVDSTPHSLANSQEEYNFPFIIHSLKSSLHKNCSRENKYFYLVLFLSFVCHFH